MRLRTTFIILAILIIGSGVGLLLHVQGKNADLRQDLAQRQLDTEMLARKNQKLSETLAETIDRYDERIQTELSKLNTVEQENIELAEKIARIELIYDSGIRELSRKLDAIQSDAPDLLEDTGSLIRHFLQSAGASATYSTNALLFLVSTYPDTLSEALYERLKREQGIQRYELRYPFSRSPLANTAETIVTSTYGERFRAIDDLSRVKIEWIEDSQARITGFDGVWNLKRIEDREVLIQKTEHLAYDLVNRRDNRVFAPFEGTIVLDLPDYGPYGRTVFFEFYFDGTPYRYQLSHLSRDLAHLESGQKIVPGELLGYTGDTGYTTGEHLHLALWKPNPEKEGYWMPMDMFIPPADAQISNVLYIQHAYHR
jgi:murein DD-endopeptidase MepM/ murein hydrolase activator NlpD